MVFTIYQNPEEVSSNASGEMDLPARVRSSRQREKASFFHVLYIGLPAESVARIKGISSHLNDLVKKKKSHIWD